MKLEGLPKTWTHPLAATDCKTPLPAGEHDDARARAQTKPEIPVG